jgi:lactoylglutathione lyase
MDPTNILSATSELRALTKNCSPDATPAVSLTLIVLRSINIDAARDFYGLLGLSFAEEQHGDGPRHYAAMIGPLVLEIYPCQENTPPAPLRLGFRVPSLEQTLTALRKSGARIIREAMDSPWGRRALVEDPDRNRIELT